MAAQIPAKLRQAGIAPFMTRAAQLANAEPVMAYWCQYWIVNQILAKQLHNGDDECLQFTTMLMDRLEQTKSEQAGNDAILDDVAGQAYVENFASKTLERAIRPLRANKVTRQTADTFHAAATFLELLNIWGRPGPETQKNITFSKWNAARILKAIKEGKDPNESNPQPEEPKEEDDLPALDPNDPEVQLIGSDRPRPAAVEDAPDEERALQPPASSYSLKAPPPVSEPTSPLPPATVPDQVSPIAPPDPGSYFPNAPQPPTNQSPLDLPSTASMPPPGSGMHDPLGPPPVIPSPSTHEPGMPPAVPSAPPNAGPPPQDFYRAAPQPQAPPSPPIVQPQPRYVPPTTRAASTQSHHQRQQPTPQPPVVPTMAAPPLAQPAQQYGGDGGSSGPYKDDDVAIMEAQKHAKWAISALNFEDVATAVKELQAALATLGAR
ncbi:Vta1 like-domain-containing protein [Xylariaceae sp. FL0804]|nr:Vta1 like-domain-containing protein [Xylariaceae sp. FL0804]